MKQSLRLIFYALLFSFSASAQITIANTDFKISTTSADSAINKLMRRTTVIPTEGLNQTWDYSTLRDSVPEIYYLRYITRPATNIPSAFAGTIGTMTQADHFTFFQNYSLPTRSYYSTNSVGYGLLGDSITFTRFALPTAAGDSLTFPGQVRKLSTAWRYYRFPMTMSTEWSGTTKHATNFLLKVGLLGGTNTPGQYLRTTTFKDSVVGWGTLRLRNPSTGGILSFNTLLVREQAIGLDSFFLAGTPANPLVLGAFGLTQGSRDTTSTYYFFGTNFKGPHFSIIMDGRFSRITNVFRSISTALGLTLDNKDLTDISATVFPNPTTEGVSFEFEKSTAAHWRVFIYNAAGQIIKNEYINAPTGKVQHRTHFEPSLANGTYFYQIIDDNSLIRNTGKIQLNR